MDFLAPDLVLVDCPVEFSENILGAVVFVHRSRILIIIWIRSYVIGFEFDFLLVVDAG
jgi:hypothetical protein